MIRCWHSAVVRADYARGLVKLEMFYLKRALRGYGDLALVAGDSVTWPYYAMGPSATVGLGSDQLCGKRLSWDTQLVVRLWPRY